MEQRLCWENEIETSRSILCETVDGEWDRKHWALLLSHFQKHRDLLPLHLSCFFPKLICFPSSKVVGSRALSKTSVYKENADFQLWEFTLYTSGLFPSSKSLGTNFEQPARSPVSLNIYCRICGFRFKEWANIKLYGKLSVGSWSEREMALRSQMCGTYRSLFQSWK